MYNYSSWIDEINPTILFDLFRQKLTKSGFGIENIIEKHFEPHGYTALFLLSESHFAIHTFPEHNQSYIEISSCVKKPFDDFIKNL